jgi:hypothetical protein
MRKWIYVKVLWLIVGKNRILCCVCGEIIHWVGLFCEICLWMKNIDVWVDIVIIISDIVIIISDIVIIISYIVIIIISASGLIFDLRIE